MLDGKKIKLLPGQFVTGRKKIASDLKVSESKVQRILKLFEIEHQIEQQMASKGRVIAICNWDKYQNSEHHTEQIVNSKRTGSEQVVNTKQERKNVKKEKNVKEIIKEKVSELPAGLQGTVNDFLDMRDSIKAPIKTEKGLTLILNKLNKLSNGDVQASREILEQSIMNSYKGVFPLKQQRNEKRNEVLDLLGKDGL